MYDYDREGSALCPLTESQEDFLDDLFEHWDNQKTN